MFDGMFSGRRGGGRAHHHRGRHRRQQEQQRPDAPRHMRDFHLLHGGRGGGRGGANEDVWSAGAATAGHRASVDDDGDLRNDVHLWVSRVRARDSADDDDNQKQ